MFLALARKAAAAGLLFATVLTAQAAPLYGANGTLYSIDAATGASVAIASGNSAYRLGLAWNGNTKSMYSLGLFDGVLSTVDLATGNTTAVGPSNGLPLTGLSFDTTYSTLYSLNSNGGPLVSMNPSTGAATVIGGGANNMLDLSMDSGGVLFGGGFGGIGTFNIGTGAFSLIGGTLNWTAIAFDDNDILYGIEIASDALYTIDTSTGAATLVGGNIGTDVRGMSFAAAVPEPGTLALLGLGLAGLAVRRRRKQ